MERIFSNSKSVQLESITIIRVENGRMANGRTKKSLWLTLVSIVIYFIK